MPPLGAALASSLLAQWQQEGRNSWVGFWRGEVIFPYALAQLSARFKERGHSFRAASTWHWKLGPSETFGHLF